MQRRRRPLAWSDSARTRCATTATILLVHGADIAKAQDMLGHANIQSTRIYDRRMTRPEDSPVLKVAY